MLTVEISTNYEDVVRDLLRFERQAVPGAARHALLQVGNAAKAALEHEMRDVFDRPKPWTTGSVRVDRRELPRMAVTVGHTDDTNKQGVAAYKYLLPNIRGGLRRLKRFEKALRSVSRNGEPLLPNGMVAVAGKAATMDAYGNVSAGQINQILSWFRAFGESGYRANLSDRRRARLQRGTRRTQGFTYFVGRPGDGKLPLGVWKRVEFGKGSAIKPILIFVDGAIYESIYDVRDTVERAVNKNWAREYRKALAQLSGSYDPNTGMVLTR